MGDKLLDLDPKTIISLGVIALGLLLLPRESPIFAHSVRLTDQYGEFHFVAGDRLFVLARNSTKDRVSLDLSGVMLNLAVQAGDQHTLDRRQADEVLPMSTSLIITNGQPDSLAARRVSISDGFYFQPGDLRIATASDDYLRFVFIGVFGAAVAVLVFLMARYIVDRTAVPASKERAD